MSKDHSFTALPKIIVAYDRNHVIGANNAMPWPSMRHDLRRFREITSGNVVIMGRATFESIGKPLANRENVILSSDIRYSAPGARVFQSYEDALDHYSDDERELFVIGGGKLYGQALALSRIVLATEIQASYEGDTYFPNLQANGNWIETSRESYLADDNNPHNYDFVTYESTRLLADASKARSELNKRDLEHIEQTKECPFCEKRVIADGRNQLLEEGSYWYVTKNYLPYENASNHLLLIPKRHIETTSDMGSQSQIELMRLITKYTVAIKSGGIALRFGDISHTGATVAHLHVHIIEPQHDLDADHKVAFKISR